MKKFKLMFSTFCLAIVLTFAGGTFTNVYATEENPQGDRRTSQPTPPPSILIIIATFLGLI